VLIIRKEDINAQIIQLLFKVLPKRKLLGWQAITLI